MTVVETVLIYVGVPLAVVVLLALLTVLPSSGRRPRYRSGQSWDFAPVWWSANPAGLGHGRPDADGRQSSGGTVVGGGARGTW